MLRHIYLPEIAEAFGSTPKSPMFPELPISFVRSAAVTVALASNISDTSAMTLPFLLTKLNSLHFL